MTQVPAVSAFLLLTMVSWAQTAVTTQEQLGDALRAAGPGSQILVAPGTYVGGFTLRGLRGRPGSPVVVAGADSLNPPVFEGGGTSFHLIDAEHVEIRDLVLRGASANGLNIDDGGSYDTPAHHIVLRRVRVTDVGERGNQDAIKLSGVDDFRVEACTVERWGGAGSGIDMVGCHRGVIEESVFRHSGGAGGSGVQAKGGSEEIVIRRCRFENAGSRAVNIGGSTGLQYFRPPLVSPPFAEARSITVEGNTFIGSAAPIAFVGVDGAAVRYNTIYAPGRWAVRILQETTEEGFVACGRGEFSRNIVAFFSDRWSEGGANTGPGTDPASFVISSNFWYCLDDPTKSRPRLPVDEKDGTYGVDPGFRDAPNGDVRLGPDSAAKAFGAEALK